MIKNLSEYLIEMLNENVDDIKVDDVVEDDVVKESEETIKDEKSFREAARAKFEEVFGDELDEDQMNETIKGLLDDNKELVEKGEWGELIGMLNKSFGKKSGSDEK